MSLFTFAALLFVGASVLRGGVGRPFAPPCYPDPAHVFNGCHLSALRYLNQFAADYPAEQGEPLVVRMRNGDGLIRSHTVALVSWRGQWWCRDEYFGVFPLRTAVAGPAAPDLLRPRAQELLERHASDWNARPDNPRPPLPPPVFDAALRLRQVETAAALTPFPHGIHWVDGVPLLLIRPSANQIAVYDPANGTGSGVCRSGDDRQIVQFVAHSMGYR
jgi:hypothetical protein